MVDLRHLRQALASGQQAAVVSSRWLKEVERDLSELHQRRVREATQ